MPSRTDPRSSLGAGPDRPSLKIDPRFARRWTQVRREEGRRRLRILVVAGAVALVLAAAVGSLYTPLLAVRHIRITTVGPVSRAEVLAAAGLSQPRPLIEVDPGGVAARLDAVADLGGAVVRRSWPTTILIHVARRTPIAMVRTSTAHGRPPWATVDATGRVLADVRAPLVGLPLVAGVGTVPAPGRWLTGSAGPKAPAATSVGRSLINLEAAADGPALPSGPGAALGIVAALPPQVHTDVQAVSVGSAGQLTLSVLPATMATGSIFVDLGDGSQLAEKLTSLAALLTEANLSGVAGIDLTVPDRPATLTRAPNSR
jgi:hypothetical protein